MKILHSADWHIGKKYNNTEFLPDFEFFAHQLLNIIESEKINVLLVSGDVFDAYNPSIAAQKAYYHILARLNKIDCLHHIFISAGNHDSASFLEAPATLINAFNIDIIGQASTPENAWKTISTNGETANIACIPFLRNSDFPSLDDNATYRDVSERNAQGLIKYYSQAYSYAPKNKAINIAMGHFTCIQDYTIDSERNISIGNIDGTGKNELPTFDYFALGHIHKPITVSKNKNIYYSGSPYPMSFSEKNDVKRVNILHLNKNEVDVKFIELKNYRQFLSIAETSINAIENALQNLKPNTEALQIELVLKSDEGTVAMHKQLMEIQHSYNDAFIAEQKNINIEKVQVVSPSHEKNALEKPDFNRDFKSPEELLDNIIEKYADKYGNHSEMMKSVFQEIINQ